MIILPFLMEDVPARKWVSDNLVGKGLSWETAKQRFVAHFQSYDYSLVLHRDFKQCKPGAKESTQSYADRFLSFTSRLGLDESNPLVITQFLDNLSPAIYKRYWEWIGDRQFDDPTFRLDSLSKVVARCVAFDVAHRTANLSSPSSSDSGDSSQSRDRKPKKCQYHPNSTNHSTAECKTKGGDKSKQQFPSTSPSPATPGKRDLKDVKCHACNNMGHYANSTDCPARAQRQHQQQQQQQSTPTSQSNPKWNQPPASSSSSGVPFSTQTRGMKAKAEGSVNPTARSVQFATEDSALPPQLNTVELARGPPAAVFLPRRQSVLLVLGGHIFLTLLDTGANVSVVAQQVVEELGLKVTPLPGSVKLAHAGATVERVGRTEPLDVQALFLGPPATTPPALSFSHSFEVMPLDTSQYAFLVGMDLIQILFPNSIPSEFYPPAHGPSPSLRAVSVSASAPPSDVVITTDRNLMDGLAELQQVISNEGLGTVPEEERPERASAFTPVDMESQYASERQRLLSDPAIVEALEINSRITGFCNVPESVLRLEVDPAKRHTLFRKQYPIPHTLLPATREVIKRWDGSGVLGLAPPGCEYNNPLTLAPKKNADGQLVGVRVCEDTRAVNAAQPSKDRFPLPHIPDILEIFGGCTIFGEFDCEEAYLHFQLHPDSQPLTAFTFEGTQYMFKGCPFGLSCMPSHFQRIMNYIFKDLPFTYPYLDNLPFASKSWEEHRDHALAIILRLNAVNMKIKPSSVNIGQSHLKCLGHLLSVSGIGISPAKAEAIRNWELPTTGKQLQSFLGFVTFIRRSIRHYADISGPLEAVKNDKVIEWTDTLRECFHTIKEAVAKAPFLQFPDFSRAFHIATDASNVGCGGVLYQPAEGEDITPTNIVSICSRKWSKSQLNYPAFKKELYGIVYCLRQFHSYVWGRGDLVIYTDHKPLTYFLEQKELSVALQQWLDVLLDYQFRIEYRPGILNVLPDALSRMFSASYPQTWGIPLPADPPSSVPSSPDAQSANPSVSLSVAVVLTGEGVALASVDLAVELEKRGAKAPAESERPELIRKTHLFGHFGREAVYKSLLAQGYWWPKMRDDIQQELVSCDPCTRFTVTKSGFNPSQFISANGPFDHVQVDTSVHMPASPDGFTALLVVIDVFTGFVLLRPLRNTTAESVALQLWDIFSTFGLPQILQSDNGPEFTNDTLRALVKLTGIDHRLISPYNPRADGKVERSIGTCTSIIKKLLHGTTQHWPLFVPFAQLSFNHKISSLTGSSPFSLMFGRQLNELRDYTGEEPKAIPLDSWKQHQEKILSLIFPAVSERVRLSKSKMVQQLNKTRRTLLHSAFPNGAIVMLKDQLRANKWEPKYVGPYTVVRRTRNGNYVLRDATGDILDRHTPPDQLKLVSRKARPEDVENAVYEVERILGHRGSAPAWEFLTKWKGFRETTWEPASSFHDTALITDYWKNPSSGGTGRSQQH